MAYDPDVTTPQTAPIDRAFVDRREGQLVVTRDEAQVFPLDDGVSKQFTYHHAMGTKTVGFHVSEYAAGFATDTHRHLCEAVLYVVSGSGYALVDGTRVDWKAGDAVNLPPNAWHSLHMGDEPVTMLGIWNIPLMEALGLFYYEPAPGGAAQPVGTSADAVFGTGDEAA